MFIPGKERYTDITPQDFERESLRFLQNQADQFEESSFEHNVIMPAHDGSYQIDGVIKFTYLGVHFVCLVECKKYKGPIEREKVAELYAKMQSIGAQKGIFVTTSYYQSGALLYAKEHGIALITLTDEGATYHQRSDDVLEVHFPINGSYYVPVFTEAISENSYSDHCIYDKTCSGLVDFLKK